MSHSFRAREADCDQRRRPSVSPSTVTRTWWMPTIWPSASARPWCPSRTARTLSRARHLSTRSSRPSSSTTRSSFPISASWMAQCTRSAWPEARSTGGCEAQNILFLQRRSLYLGVTYRPSVCPSGPQWQSPQWTRDHRRGRQRNWAAHQWWRSVRRRGNLSFLFIEAATLWPNKSSAVKGHLNRIFASSVYHFSLITQILIELPWHFARTHTHQHLRRDRVAQTLAFCYLHLHSKLAAKYCVNLKKTNSKEKSNKINNNDKKERWWHYVCFTCDSH